ncbi:hypothetical protein AB0K48_60635 [Nonomuraea sp. NPDC055795]
MAALRRLAVVLVTGGGTLVTHLCHTATLSGTTLTGKDCRQASG